MLAVLAVLIASVNSELIGSITISESGSSKTRYVVGTWAGGASTNTTHVFLKHNAQIQIAANASSSYSPFMFQEYKLDGKTVSFTVDLSGISCSCNAAFYFVSMPGYGSDGQPNGGDSGDYYCDANDVNGQYCWELDVMEANKYVTQATPHKCYASPGGYISSCDGSGCATNSHNENSNGMGPASSYEIDTTLPFRQSMTLSGSSISVTLTQGSSTFSFDACSDSSYISDMNEALDYGMVLVMSYWGDSYSEMSWLDANTGCTGDCDTSGTAIFGDISIE